jgi:hypothetical protein
LREIRDGVFTEGKDEFGGAASQAWSLAEVIRVCLTDFLRFRDATEPPGAGSSKRSEATAASSSRRGEAKGTPGCDAFHYMGIERWISASPTPDAKNIPPSWGEGRYRIFCTKSCGKDVLAPSAGKAVLEGSVKTQVPGGKGQKLR